MGTALLRGLLEAKLTPFKKISVVDVQKGRLDEFKRRFDVNVTTDAAGPVSKAKIVILAAKPQTLSSVLDATR